MASHGNARRSFGYSMRGATVALGFLLLSACTGRTPGDTDTATIFYPPLPELPRLQFLTTINTADDIGGSSGISLLGGGGAGPNLLRPFDVAHEKGKVHIADPNQASIVTVDLAGKKFDLVQETEGGPFKKPMGIFVTPNGNKYIADVGRGQILVLDETNAFLRAYGKKGQFQPLSVAVNGDRVYVCDVQNNEVEVLDRESGETISKIGSRGASEGYFQWPTRVTFDSEGNFYVTDSLNFRVQKFDGDGQFVAQIGEAGNWPGSMPRPKGIAIDREGYLYVVDAAFELVQIFDSRTGEVLLGFGKNGPKPGGNWLPAGIDIDYDNLEYFAKYVDKNFRAKYLVYVTNQAGPRKLNVYAFGDWIGPPPKGAIQPADTEKPADAGS